MENRSIIRLPEVMAKLSISKSTIYKLVESGQLKKPMKLSARAVGWLETDVQDFINERNQARG